jgi:alginate O-acetyltransferase complex protein AlgI
MNFSDPFFVFILLPIIILVYVLLNRFGKTSKSSLVILIALSIIFYFISNGNYLIVLIFTLLVNYVFYKLIIKCKNKYFFVLGIIVNLLILFYFKYTSFIFENINLIVGIDLKIPIQRELPVGISFFTFMCISFLVESHTKKNTDTTLVKFASYILMFPHLVAGPIIRYSEISSSLSRQFHVDKDRLRNAAIIFTQGFAMKVVIADSLAPVADTFFGEQFVNSQLNFTLAWIGAVTYTLQIFFDFAGYSLMAIGLGKLIGFDFPINFDRPYQAKNMNEFWKKWHMTLTRWMKDYLYVPLGGNKYGNTRTYLNILVVFLISGLWHGASWNYVLWGLFNGVVIVVERLFKIDKKSLSIKRLTRIVTIFLIIIGWVIFRCTSVTILGEYLTKMFYFKSITQYNLSEIGFFVPKFMLISILFVFLITFFGHKRIPLVNKLSSTIGLQTTIYLLIFGFASIITLFRTYQPFIYFRF